MNKNSRLLNQGDKALFYATGALLNPERNEGFLSLENYSHLVVTYFLISVI